MKAIRIHTFGGPEVMQVEEVPTPSPQASQVLVRLAAAGLNNKYPPAKPEVLRLLAPQRGLTAIAKSKPNTEQTTNGRLPELSNFESPPAEPGVYYD